MPKNDYTKHLVTEFIADNTSVNVKDYYNTVLENLNQNALVFETTDLLIPFRFIDLYNLNEYSENPLFYSLILFLIWEVYNGSLCGVIKKGNVLYPLLTELLEKRGDFIEKVTLNSEIKESRKVLVCVERGDECFVYFNVQFNNFIKLKKECEKFNFLKNDFEEEEINKSLQSVLQSTNLVLNKEQESAILQAIIKPFTLIKGGPGTGKTTVTNIIFHTLLKIYSDNKIIDPKIVFLAPTGKAVARIQESLASLEELNNLKENIKIEIKTIHRFIKEREKEIQGHTKDVHYTYNINTLIIDELSMVSQTLLYNLFTFIAPNTKIIMLGDPYQLPSVEEGDVFGFFMQSAFLNQNIVSLTKLIRAQNPDLLGLINTLANLNFKGSSTLYNPFSEKTEEQLEQNLTSDFFAHFSPYIKEIGQGALFSELQNSNTQGVFFVDVQKDFSSNFYKELFDFLYIPFYENLFTLPKNQQVKDLLEFNGKIKILSPLKQGSMGSDTINNAFYKWYLQFFGQDFLLPFMVNKNNPLLNLFNGDTGVLEQTKEQKIFYVQKKEGIFPYNAENLEGELTLSFASTVHKSQGSEYDTVILMIPHNTPYSLLTRQIFYTGVSRAKKKVIIIGQKKSLEMALKTRFNRNNGAFL